MPKRNYLHHQSMRNNNNKIGHFMINTGDSFNRILQISHSSFSTILKKKGIKLCLILDLIFVFTLFHI